MESVPSNGLNGPVSLRHVAAAAGVGVATASRALSGHPRVAAETRERVREVAERLGYRPNPLMAALGARKFRQAEARRGLGIAFLMRSPKGIGAVERYEKGAAERAEMLGYRLIRRDCSGENELGPLLKRLRDIGVAGVLLTPWQDGVELLHETDWSEFAVMQCGRSWEPTPFHTVRDDVGGAVRTAWEKALALGYERPGFAFFRHEPMHPDDFEREAMAAQCLRVAGLDPELLFIHPVGSDLREAAPLWFAETRPDCLITLPHGVRSTLRWSGMLERFPVGYLSLGSYANEMNRITGFQKVEEDVGRLAVDQIDFQVRRGEKGVPELRRTLTVTGRWIDGGSGHRKG